MTIRTTILDEMNRVSREQKRDLQPLHDEAPLLTIGLDSLCFAILVARLEEKLGADPFAAEEVTLPVTVGDLVTFYEQALLEKHSA